jgi:hypothetical protein
MNQFFLIQLIVFLVQFTFALAVIVPKLLNFPSPVAYYSGITVIVAEVIFAGIWGFAAYKQLS